MREGLEYEFDIVGTMDDDNTFAIDNTRCSAYSAERLRTAVKPGTRDFAP